MKKIAKKSVLAFLLALILLLQPQGMVWAHTNNIQPDVSSGMIPVQLKYAVDSEEAVQRASVYANLSQGDYDWDCYGSDYYFTKLSKQEQTLYLQMDAACKELLTQSVDAEKYTMGDGSVEYATKKIPIGNLSTDTIKKVRDLFYYSNPQYFFLNPALVYASGQNAYTALGVYPKFADASKRQAETQVVKQCLEEYKAGVQVSGSQAAMDQSIRDLICTKLKYHPAYKNADPIASDPDYTQTIYGALMSGQTICAGYTKLYVLLCNAFGIECVPAISKTHGWNYVRYGQTWYAVDLTWDDADYATKSYFRVSDSELKSADTSSGDHTVVPQWQALVPTATDSYHTKQDEQSLLTAPQIMIKDTPKGVKLTFDAPDGDIYYAIGTDENLPERKAAGSVSLTSGGMYVVTAKAVREGCLDSKYTVAVVQIAEGDATISTIVNRSNNKIRLSYQVSQPCEGYEICYASDRKFTDAKTKKLTAKSAVIKGLKKNEICFVRVRGYKTDAYGNYYYTPYSVVKRIKVTK